MPGARANAAHGGESSVSKRQSKNYAESTDVTNGFPGGGRYDTRPGWKLFLWNPQTREFLGRSASSWARVILFYVVFYLFLAGFFVIMMIVFFHTLRDDRPKYTAKGQQSILSAPGLSIRPDWSHTISYNMNNKFDSHHHVFSIEKLIGSYEKIREDNKELYAQCSDSPVPKMVCDFDVSQLRNESSPDWGYDSTSPSVILKLNKIFDWEPEVYNGRSSRLPQDLKEYIQNNVTNAVRMIWVWCNSNYEEVTFTYTPQAGFPAFYYPFYNQKGYLAPLVAVSINNLPLGHYVKVTCTAYAENIGNPLLQFIVYVQ